MKFSTARRRKWDESRHLIGGIILLSLLFFSYYLPLIATLLMMIIVAWMAIVSISGWRTAISVSGVSFLFSFGLLLLRHWRSFRGVDLGWVDSIESSLQFSLLCSMVFGAIVWVKSILRSRQAGFDEVLGAFNLYIWIATIYACFYTLIAKTDVTSFHLQKELVGMNPLEIKRNFSLLYYFSFATQTTLGYGDIVPVAHIARALAVSQAMIGQFYVAVVLTYILNLWIRDLGRHVDQKIESVPDGKHIPNHREPS